jgi:predicted nucleic acid-binding protein
VGSLRLPRIGGQLLALDTMVFVYHLQAHPRYAGATTTILDALEKNTATAVASVISLLEVLVHPYRKGHAELARRYRSLLAGLPGLRFVPLDEEIADLAARLRAEQGLGAADAAVVATAVQAGATLFVTNDRRLKRRRLPVRLLLLDDIA